MLNEKLINIPFSYNNYYINNNSEIVDKENIKIPIIIKDSKAYIKLDWINGFIDYDLSLVLVISFFNIKIPATDFNKIEVVFKDKNTLNTNISNLSYKFREPIECINLKGYFYIPFYTDYVINKNGDIFSYKKNKFKKWSITKAREKKNITGGYFVCYASNDLNKAIPLYRHRALCLVFKDCPGVYSDYIVNHRDGIPGNDFLDNLEWVTYSQNNQHAYDNNLLKNKTVKILCLNYINKEITSFNSIAECSRKLNISEGLIRHRLKNNHVCYSDNLIFKKDDDTIWPVIKEFKNTIIINKIISRNIFTGVKIIFKNSTEASSYCNVSNSAILNQCNNLDIEAIFGYNFRYFEKDIEWPNHNEKHLLIYKNGNHYYRRGVLLLDQNNKEIKFFPDIEKAAKAFNLSISCIKRYCKNNKQFNGIKFTFYNLTDNLGPPIK
jgi:hypothetical protein